MLAVDAVLILRLFLCRFYCSLRVGLAYPLTALAAGDDVWAPKLLGVISFLTLP